MKIKIKPLIDGAEQEVEATAYDAIRSIDGNVWYYVTDGTHFWRVKKPK